MTVEEFVEMVKKNDKEFMFEFLDLNAEVGLRFRPENWGLWIYVVGLNIFPGTGLVREICSGDIKMLPEEVRELILDWLEERFEELAKII